MRASVDWLNAAFDRDGVGYVDDRGGAVAGLLAGLVVLAWPLSRLLPRVAATPRGRAPGRRPLLALGAFPAIATPILLLPVPPDLMGMLVGGYLAAHFGLYGLLTAFALSWWRRRAGEDGVPGGETSVPRLAAATFVWTAWVAGAIGLTLDTYFTSLAPTPARVPLIAAMLAGTVLYFLADEWLTRGIDAPRFGYAYTKVCFLGSLALAVAMSFEDLFFLVIIAVMILIFFLVYGLFSGWAYRSTRHPAVGALANAALFGWALAVTFPLLSGA
jgi:hypothetical protein